MDIGFAGARRTRFMLVMLASLFAITLSSVALAATDSDADLMTDDWETAYGFNPYDPSDAAVDTDGDGFSNVDEFRTGTDPVDVSSFPVPTTTWFESFEDGVPADWDTSSDATTDAWIQSPQNATNGDFSLRSPEYYYDGVGSSFVADTISVTRNFAGGVLLADYTITNNIAAWVTVLIDGNLVLDIVPSSSAGGTLAVNVPAGIHTVTFHLLRPMQMSHLYIDNVRFQSANADSDNDGLPDLWELQNGLNPDDPSDALADLDGDGLSNLDEYTAGSSITNADTDGDGLLDGDEVVLGSNVLNADSDFDGLPDGWEVDNGLDPLNTADALGDNDGDGFSNLDEYRLGTNPQDGDSVPQPVTRWFESFENGIPADATSDSSSDASSDQWIAGYVYATDGSRSALSPQFKLSNGGAEQSRTLSFTKYFETGTLTADVQLLGQYYSYNARAEVLVDGYPVATYWYYNTWNRVSLPISQGVHTVAFRVTGYAVDAHVMVLPRVLVDNIRFVFDGDTDGDGIPDQWEFDHGLNPDDAFDGGADNDNDGLSNAQEYLAGTNLNAADSDGDGLNDGDEVARGTNPLNGDSDGDGLSDADEVRAGLDPLNGADAAQDSDGDGVSNYDEIRLGTDPLDPASVPQVTTRWFESFEAGVPADWDASSDTSSDATSDDWTVTNEFATDGALSLTAPVGSPGYIWQYKFNQISFTKLFVAGRLSLDVKAIDPYWNGDNLQVLVDGIAWSFLRDGQQRVLIELSAGVHTVSIRHEGYTTPDYYTSGQSRAFVDNVRFISNGDSDGDGLSDIWEIDNGFDPDVADSQLDADNDGLSNADEFAAGTNPNNADSDSDGLNDGAEVAAGTNPNSADSDADGLSDSYELANGFDPLDGTDAAADADGDGFSNIDEFRIGTDPHDSASKPQLTTSWFESFENGLPSDWDASTDASADAANWPWLQSQQFVTDGASSLQSAPVPLGKRTQVYVTRFFAEGTLSFDFSVAYSYYNCCDNLIVTVDGEERVYGYNATSGRRFIQLTRGVHEIRFTFIRDSYDPYPEIGPRAAWIDNLRFEQGALEPDYDGDGIPDAWEILNGLDAYNPWDADLDYDGDGLNNRQEFLAGTQIYNADSDGDGLSDAEEVDVIGSNPLDGDSDHDGLPDAWEVSNGFNPNDAADANLDSDGDGFSNYQEFLWGTDANDPGQPARQQAWFESFEAGFPADWDASGDTSSDASTDASSDAPWEVSSIGRVPDGIYRLRSGSIGYLQNSAVSVSKFLEPGVLFFDYQVSSYLRDTLSVYVNGDLKLTAKYGILNSRAEIEIAGGYEQIKFVFQKNSKLLFASNAAFIDNVVFLAHGYDGDFDGMEDIWEVRNGLNPNDPTDALKDPDLDRVNNLQEYRNGTDPHRYNRPPRATPVTTTAPPAANAGTGGTSTGSTGTGGTSGGTTNGAGNGTSNSSGGSGSSLPSISGGGGGAIGGLLLLAVAGVASRRRLFQR